MIGIAGALAGDGPSSQDFLWVSIPAGYFPMPIEDTSNCLRTAEAIISDVTNGDRRDQARALVGTLEVFLDDLAAVGAVYCGIGRHASPADETVVTSTLVVSHQNYEGTRNPRLLLSDILHAKSEADEQGEANLVDVLERPVLFFEWVRSMPTPRFPTQPEIDNDSTTPVFQLEAHVPSDDGSELAVIEFSTPFIHHGPMFRTMIVEMTASISFEPPKKSGSSSRIQQLLG